MPDAVTDWELAGVDLVDVENVVLAKREKDGREDELSAAVTEADEAVAVEGLCVVAVEAIETTPETETTAEYAATAC